MESLASIREWLNQSLSDWSVPENVRNDLALAVTEFCSNIVRHGYANRAGKIDLEALRRNDAVRLTITDDAPLFIPNYDKSKPLGQLREGGYGLHLIESLVDDIAYEPLGVRGNRVTLTKQIRKA